MGLYRCSNAITYRVTHIFILIVCSFTIVDFHKYADNTGVTLIDLHYFNTSRIETNIERFLTIDKH